MMTWILLLLGSGFSAFCGIALINSLMQHDSFKYDVLMFLGVILGFVVSFLAVAIERGVIF